MQLYDRAQAAATCDSLQRHQESENRKAVKLQVATDSLLSLTSHQLVLSRADRGMADQQIDNQKNQTKAQARKKKKWMFIAGGIVVVWVSAEVIEQQLLSR